MTDINIRSVIKRVQAGIEWVQRSRLMRANTHLGDQAGAVLTAGLAFQTVFAVFGAVWVCFSFFGIYLRGNPELLDTIVQNLGTQVPGLFGDGGMIDVRQLLGGSGMDLSSVVSSLSLIWLIVTWFAGTRSSIRLICGLPIAGYKNPMILIVKDFFFAILFGVLLLVSSVISAAVSVLTSGLLDQLLGGATHPLFAIVTNFISWLVSIGLYWFVLWAMHKWHAEVKINNKRLWWGTLPGAIGLLILTLLSSKLLGGATANPLLASVAVLIGIFLWFNIVNKVILFTSAFVAVGEDKNLGLPWAMVEKKRKQQEHLLSMQRVGIDGGVADIDDSLIEPAARARG